MSFGQNILFSAPIALFLAVIAWPNTEATPQEPVAQEFVKVFEGVFPKTLGDGSVIAAPKAEGDILIFSIAPSAELSQTFSGAEMERLNLNAACVSGKGLTGFFNKGGKLRFDVKNHDGAFHRGQTRTSC